MAKKLTFRPPPVNHEKRIFSLFNSRDATIQLG